MKGNGSSFDSSGAHTVCGGCCLAPSISHEAKCRLEILLTGGRTLLPYALGVCGQGSVVRKVLSSCEAFQS